MTFSMEVDPSVLTVPLKSLEAVASAELDSPEAASELAASEEAASEDAASVVEAAVSLEAAWLEAELDELPQPAIIVAPSIPANITAKTDFFMFLFLLLIWS